MYRVVYLIKGKREWLPGNLSLEGAKKTLRQMKRRGLTAWVVDEQGSFVPVPGTSRQPGYIE